MKTTSSIIVALLPVLGLSGCAPLLHPDLTRIEIPAQCPERLLLLPLEDRNDAPAGSRDIVREAPRVVRDLLENSLRKNGMDVFAAADVDSAAAVYREANGDLWTRDGAATLARSFGTRYVAFGTLKSYYRGSMFGRSTRVAWEIELMDAWTRHPLARLTLDVRGAQKDPFLLARETADESAREFLRAWDSCPTRH